MKSKKDFPIATKESLKLVIIKQKIEYTETSIYSMIDSSSFLEQLRQYQLETVLGKYKLF